MSINPLNDISRVYLDNVAVNEVKVEQKLPGSSARRTRKSENGTRQGKPKRWWDDDGDGVGWEKGEVKEVKKWFDDDGDRIGYEEGEVSGQFRKKKKKSVKEGYSNWRSDLIEVMDIIDNSKKNDEKIVEKEVNNKIKINPTIGEAIENLGGVLLEMEELDEKAYRGLGVGRVERVSSGSYQAPETTGAAAKRKKAEESKPVVAVKKKKAKEIKPAVTAKTETPTPKEEGRPARRRRRNSPSYSEVKAEIEAREQANKKKSKKKKRKSKLELDDLLASIRSEGLFDGSIRRYPSGPISKPKPSSIKTAPSKIQSGPKITQMNSYELEGNQIDEKTLTPAETEEKERIVKSMKSKAPDFEERYPGRGEEVMYATATEMAKKIVKQRSKKSK